MFRITSLALLAGTLCLVSFTEEANAGRKRRCRPVCYSPTQACYAPAISTPCCQPGPTCCVPQPMSSAPPATSSVPSIRPARSRCVCRKYSFSSWFSGGATYCGYYATDCSFGNPTSWTDSCGLPSQNCTNPPACTGCEEIPVQFGANEKPIPQHTYNNLPNPTPQNGAKLSSKRRAAFVDVNGTTIRVKMFRFTSDDLTVGQDIQLPGVPAGTVLFGTDFYVGVQVSTHPASANPPTHPGRKLSTHLIEADGPNGARYLIRTYTAF